MQYTKEEGGRLNNFAVEPKVYAAEPATKEQQRNKIVIGVGGLLLVIGLISVAYFTSAS